MTRLLAAALMCLGLMSVTITPGAAADVVRPEEGQVERLYLAALGRQPEGAGFEFWTIRLVEGQSLLSVAQFFVNSPEFEQRFDAESDDGFLDLVYQNVLGREPDSGGRAYWLDRLANGLGRQHLVVFFSESPEFAARTGTELPPLEPYWFDVVTPSADILGSSWRAGCPVGPSDLRLISTAHYDLGRGSNQGILIVHADVVDDVVQVLRQLYEARYPIESMDAVTAFGSDDIASMEANNTSAFNCRPVTGGAAWSRHAYGRAIDINPLYNPYQRGDVVLPASGEPFLDRTTYHPAMIYEGDVVTRAFDAVGWRWGGRWNALVDYQHFDTE